MKKSSVVRNPPSQPLSGRTYWNAVLFAFILVYCESLHLTMLNGTPSAVVARGVHQTLGSCHVSELDLSSYERRRYLCAESPAPDAFPSHAGEYWDLCDRVSASDCKGTDCTWFSICGKQDALKHGTATAYIASGLMVAFAVMLLGPKASEGGTGAGKKKKREKDM